MLQNAYQLLIKWPIFLWNALLSICLLEEALQEEVADWIHDPKSREFNETIPNSLLSINLLEETLKEEVPDWIHDPN